MSTTRSIERIDIEGLATIFLKDGTTVQTTRSISLQVDMNGPGSSQFVSHIKIAGADDYSEPYGMVDSEHPVVRQFFDRVMEIIASPERKCYDVPARAAVQAAD